jgi:hypothetical protein
MGGRAGRGILVVQAGLDTQTPWVEWTAARLSQAA